MDLMAASAETLKGLETNVGEATDGRNWHKADQVRMSALGDKADVNGELPQRPLLTQLRHLAPPRDVG
jgi:hypothetical protein